MGRVRRSVCWVVLAVATMIPAAEAQFYPQQYYPEPYYPPAYPQPYPAPYPPGYYPPPPPRELGTRCNSRLPPGYAARRLICDIVRPRPLGRPCVCPPPPPPPGYPPGPYLDGRVIP